jgi:hypothetical protein
MATKEQTNKAENMVGMAGALTDDDRVAIISHVEQVSQIIRTLPTLRRYGDDEQALKNAEALLQKIRERL